MIPDSVGCRACGKPCLPGAYRCESCSKPHAPAADGSRLFDRPQAVPAGLVAVSAMGGLETYTGPPAPVDSSAFQARLGYAAEFVETTAMTVDQVAALNALAGAEGPVPPPEPQAPGSGHQAPAFDLEAFQAEMARVYRDGPGPSAIVVPDGPEGPGATVVFRDHPLTAFEASLEVYGGDGNPSAESIAAGDATIARVNAEWEAECQAGLPGAVLRTDEEVKAYEEANGVTLLQWDRAASWEAAGLPADASPYVNTPLIDLDEVGDGRRLTCLSGGLNVPPGTHVAPPPVDPVATLGGLLRERLPAVLHLVGCAVDPIRAARVAQGRAPQPDDPVRVVVRGRSLPGVAPMVFDAELTRGDIATYADLGGLERMADELVRSARVALQNEGELMRRDDVSWLAASKGLRILTPGAGQ